MKKKNKCLKQIKDRINAVKRRIRQEEIDFHGKPINYSSIVPSKKRYKRNKYKYIKDE